MTNIPISIEKTINTTNKTKHAGTMDTASRGQLDPVVFKACNAKIAIPLANRSANPCPPYTNAAHSVLRPTKSACNDLAVIYAT
jgi:hypothetical protein